MNFKPNLIQTWLNLDGRLDLRLDEAEFPLAKGFSLFGYFYLTEDNGVSGQHGNFVFATWQSNPDAQPLSQKV